MIRVKQMTEDISQTIAKKKISRKFVIPSISGRRTMYWQDWSVLTLIILFCFAIRIYKVGDIPAGFFCDEASIGYNAYALGGWGIDENGKQFPLYINSFGGHKNPVYIYAAILPVKMFGLTEASVRSTSVIFGTLTVLGTFWLALELWGLYAGLWAALLLSLTPWNFHFSRVAFELVAWPCTFVFGLAFLVRGLRKGGWSWLGAAVMFGLTIHTYVMAVVFLPIFILIVFLLFFPNLIRQWKFTIPSLILFAAITYPAVDFRLKLKDTSHFKSTSWLSSSKNTSLTKKAGMFYDKYKRYYSYDFLFQNGDRNARHSLRNHGELYKSFVPFIFAGVFLLCFFPSRLHFMMIAWLFLFPIGAALTNQIYATRSIIGSPLAPLLAGFSIFCLHLLFQKIRWRWVSVILQIAFSVIIAFGFAKDSMNYFTRYFTKYPAMSARGIYGFQYGYREMIGFMEKLKDDYPQKVLTATNVNQPQIFANFYTKLDPTVWVKTRRNGYMIGKPEGYKRFKFDKPTLFALRPNEVSFFSDYEILHTIIDPNGQKDFVIVDVKKWKMFLTEWSTLGLFRHQRRSAYNTDYTAPYASFKQYWDTLKGQSKWRSGRTTLATLDFQKIYRMGDPKHPKNPERCWGEAVTYLYFEKETKALLDVMGSRDKAIIWLNGTLLLDLIGLSDDPIQLEITFNQGWNELFLRSFETMGDWYIGIGLSDLDGNVIEGVKQRATPPAHFKLANKTVK
jgi:4-amino-4-deoxy-L-arabinose transferase-like glycosyltransferase